MVCGVRREGGGGRNTWGRVDGSGFQVPGWISLKFSYVLALVLVEASPRVPVAAHGPCWWLMQGVLASAGACGVAASTTSVADHDESTCVARVGGGGRAESVIRRFRINRKAAMGWAESFQWAVHEPRLGMSLGSMERRIANASDDAMRDDDASDSNGSNDH